MSTNLYIKTLRKDIDHDKIIKNIINKIMKENHHLSSNILFSKFKEIYLQENMNCYEDLEYFSKSILKNMSYYEIKIMMLEIIIDKIKRNLDNYINV
jgi:ribosomal protein S7